MMTRRNLRLLAYVRVSDVRGREGPGFISPDEQSTKCRAYAEAYGHRIIEEGIELDRSGGDMDRPVLEGFLERIEHGEADGLIVAKLDRFARSNKGAWDTIARLTKANAELLCVDPNIDTSTATGRLVRDILLVTANWERERIGEQWSVAQTRAVGRGIHVSRHVPPGYQRLERSSDSDLDRRLIPDPKYGKVLSEAFAMAARGESYSDIAAYLTDQHLPIGGRATSWESNRIKRLLANRVYAGEARYGDIVNAGAHEALATELVWNLAQRTPAGPTISNQPTRMLAGLCRCASCSYSMRSQSGSAKAVSVYRCRTTSPSGRCEAPSTISQTRLEEYVLEQFLARVSDVSLRRVDDSDETSDAALVAIEAERSYREALTNMELRRTLGAADHSQLLEALKQDWESAIASLPAPTRKAPQTTNVDIAGLVDELRRPDDTQELRKLLATEIQAVFVRSAASRARDLAIEDRVHIVWADDPQLTLPKRGERFEPRAYAW